jgi:hypothetical protein
LLGNQNIRREKEGIKFKSYHPRQGIGKIFLDPLALYVLYLPVSKLFLTPIIPLNPLPPPI